MKAMIVTGASSGIGRAVALCAAREGFAIVAVARHAARLEEVAQQIHNLGGMCAVVAVDLRLPSAAPAVVSTALQRYERVDVIVHAAGTAAAGSLLDQTDAQLAEQWEVHVLAPLRLTREALPALHAARGQIFLFGSGVARVPTPGLGGYPAAKAAVRAIAIQMRRELRAERIAVTYVDPGAVDTPLMRRVNLVGSSLRLTISPQRVAERILRTTRSRRARLNVVPWQAAAVVAGELLPAITDRVLERMPRIAGAQPLGKAAAQDAEGEARGLAPSAPSGTLDQALAPLGRRMERVKLPRDFVAALLVPGARLELSEVSMRWAGMPNKNERAAMREVFDALTAAAYLERSGDETWTVLKTARD